MRFLIRGTQIILVASCAVTVCLYVKLSHSNAKLDLAMAHLVEIQGHVEVLSRTNSALEHERDSLQQQLALTEQMHGNQLGQIQELSRLNISLRDALALQSSTITQNATSVDQSTTKVSQTNFKDQPRYTRADLDAYPKFDAAGHIARPWEILKQLMKDSETRLSNEELWQRYQITTNHPRLELTKQKHY